ncbi:hypothetical protein [Longimicrobium sp.]|uniref:hypothetical protein n=1 Tax=Longimicrobium sp. TaxID=2029185 RepID=UPI003B3A1EAE
MTFVYREGYLAELERALRADHDAGAEVDFVIRRISRPRIGRRDARTSPRDIRTVNPFVTFAIGRSGAFDTVAKVLLDPRPDERWVRILNEESKRFQDLMKYPEEPATSFVRLSLPFDTAMRVEVRQTPPLSASKLFEAAGGGIDSIDARAVALTYLHRPYLPWPTLREYGIPRGAIKQAWERFAAATPVPRDADSLGYFLDTALIGRVSPPHGGQMELPKGAMLVREAGDQLEEVDPLASSPGTPSLFLIFLPSTWRLDYELESVPHRDPA